MKPRLNKIFVLLVSFLCLFGLGSSNVQAVTLYDPADRLQVSSPASGAVVRGTSSVTWRAFDDEQSSIPYEISLRQGAQCKQHFATIASGSASSSLSQNVTTTWNTKGPVGNRSSIPDGTYCLEVCVSLKNATENYSACNARWIKIKQAVAVVKPVVNPAPQPTPQVYGRSTSSSTSSAQAIVENKIIFAFPATGEVLSGKENKLEWKVETAESIKAIHLYYFSASREGELVKIAELDSSAREYTWDVSNIEEGNYRLRVEVEFDSGNKSFFSSSGIFAITAAPEEEEPVVTSRPLIISVKPEDFSTVTELRPLISGEFSKPLDSDIDPESFQFYFDDLDRLEWCEVITPTRFECRPDRDLREGVHKVRAAVQDTSSQLAAREWSFTVSSSGAIPDQPQTGNIFGLSWRAVIVFCLVCILALIILMVPWLLYLMWLRARRRQELLVVTRTEESPAEQVYTQQVLEGNDVLVIPDYYQETTPIFEKPVSAEEEIVVSKVEPEVVVPTLPDPAEFDSYEEYVAAMNLALKGNNASVKAEGKGIEEIVEAPATQTELKEVVEPKKQDDEYITIPDYTSFYESTTTEDSKPSGEENKNDPDWLRPQS